jgi:MinD superfamily P-loop ATPase
MAGQVAFVEPGECDRCGICAETCRFDAVVAPPEGDGAYRIDASACEGCAACMHQCPTGAIRVKALRAGSWFRSDTRFGRLLHGRMLAGRENSGKLVTLLRREAVEEAQNAGASFLLVDGPPGIACPAIAAMTGADLSLVVTEPTVAGVHDLERVLGVAAHFGVPSVVLINKVDLCAEHVAAIEDLCRARGAEVVGRLPYDGVVTEAMVQGVPVTEYRDGAFSRALHDTWLRLRDRLADAAGPAGGGP